jgi:heme/copper-type cytochrome/quinol oxidase subunit 1
VTFFPQHILGFLGMPRRVYTYLETAGWGEYNLISTIGYYILGAGFLALILNLVGSRLGGRTSGNDPWQADTLEWSTTSPPEYNYERIPVVDQLTPYGRILVNVVAAGWILWKTRSPKDGRWSPPQSWTPRRSG